MGPLIPLFWTSDGVCSGFQSQGGSPHLHALSPACNGILRFTAGATSADLLVATMAAEPFRSTGSRLMFIWMNAFVQNLVGFSSILNFWCFCFSGVDDDGRNRNAGQCTSDRQCPQSCVCDGSVVDCSGRKLKQIPADIPAYTRELYVNILFYLK